MLSKLTTPHTMPPCDLHRSNLKQASAQVRA